MYFGFMPGRFDDMGKAYIAEILLNNEVYGPDNISSLYKCAACTYVGEVLPVLDIYEISALESCESTYPGCVRTGTNSYCLDPS